MSWKAIPCTLRELRLKHTLKCGQSFRWQELTPSEWIGVIGRHVWKLKQDDEFIYYQVFSNSDEKDLEGKPEIPNNITTIKKEGDIMHSLNKIKVESGDHKTEIVNDEVKLEVKCEMPEIESHTTSIKCEQKMYEDILHDYFQLDVNLSDLYEQWSRADSNFKELSTVFQGIRMLRQDPVENLFSFICSTNNHISRISAMVEKLCDNFGEIITEVDGKTYHSFPNISALADISVENKLRELGFGYRAKYINRTAQYICENHDQSWLYTLRSMTYKDAKKELMKLCGVGGKVADCVCLMSMDKPGIIPIDTHMWQIAARHYMPKLKTLKSQNLTETIYKEIGNHFQSLWGEYAGWAHSVLFTADLKQFKITKDKMTKKETTSKRETTNKTTKAAKRRK